MTEYYDVAIDFDGVISSSDGYVKGLSEMPKDGAIDALHFLKDNGYSYYVLTARNDIAAVQVWLRSYGVECKVSNTKYPAGMYLDDRAYRFQDWEDALMEIGHIG